MRKERSIRVPLKQSELEKYIKTIESLRKGFDSLDDHVIITDPNGNILYANKAVERNTGYAQDEIIGKNPGDLWGGNMPKEFYDEMWRTIKTDKKPFVGEVQNQRKDKSDYWQELHIAPVLDENGEIQFFIAIEPNISDHKKRDQFKEEFLSIVGHQLRDPLAVLNWTLEWLLKNTGLPGSGQKALVDAYKTSRSISDLVSDLLAVSRIGRFGVKQDVFDLIQLIEEIIPAVKKANPKVMITFVPDGEKFTINASKPLARQVFYNLIANAAEYADKAHGQTVIRLKKESDQYIFSSENNGEPIPAQDQPKIFSKLFRASNAMKIKEKGTGLGLFIVKMICAYFGWKTYFKSPVSDNRGAAFFVEMKSE